MSLQKHPSVEAAKRSFDFRGLDFNDIPGPINGQNTQRRCILEIFASGSAEEETADFPKQELELFISKCNGQMTPEEQRALMDSMHPDTRSPVEGMPSSDKYNVIDCNKEDSCAEDDKPSAESADTDDECFFKESVPEF